MFRFAALILLLMAWGVPASAITVVDIGTGQTTSGATVTITGVTVPAGSLIVILAAEYSASTTSTGTISDGTNSYTGMGSTQNGSNTGYTNLWYSYNTTSLSSATITYTKNNSGAQAAVSAFYATGIATTSPLDTSVTTAQSGTASASTGVAFTMTSGTPSQTGELFVAAVGNRSPANPWFVQDTGNGWATPFDDAHSANVDAEVDGGNQVNAGSGTKTFAPTQVSPNTAGGYAAWILGFKSATSSTGNFVFIPGSIP